MNITFEQLIECIRNAERTVRVLTVQGVEVVPVIDPQSLVDALTEMKWRVGDSHE